MPSIKDIDYGYGVDINIEGTGCWSCGGDDEEVTIYAERIPELLEALAQWFDCATPEKHHKKNLTKAKYLLKLADYVRENELNDGSMEAGSFAWDVYLKKEERKKKAEELRQQEYAKKQAWNRLVSQYDARCFDSLDNQEKYFIYRNVIPSNSACLGWVRFKEKGHLHYRVTICPAGKEAYELSEDFERRNGRLARELWIIHEVEKNKVVDSNQ